MKAIVLGESVRGVEHSKNETYAIGSSTIATHRVSFRLAKALWNQDAPRRSDVAGVAGCMCSKRFCLHPVLLGHFMAV